MNYIDVQFKKTRDGATIRTTNKLPVRLCTKDDFENLNALEVWNEQDFELNNTAFCPDNPESLQFVQNTKLPNATFELLI